MKYQISTDEELDQINEDYYCHYPESKGLMWAGCNYYINQGKHWHEPIGTAQSMHDCDGCEKFNSCSLKKNAPTWFYS